MELCFSPRYFSHQGKISCIVSIYKFSAVCIIHLSYTYKEEYKDLYIQKEEEVDNIIEASTKDFVFTVEDETNILNLLPEKYQLTSRIIKFDKTINWDILLWNKLYKIF